MALLRAAPSQIMELSVELPTVASLPSVLCQQAWRLVLHQFSFWDIHVASSNTYSFTEIRFTSSSNNTRFSTNDIRITT